MDQDKKVDEARPSRLLWLAWAPVLLFTMAAAAFYLVDTGVTFESQVLLATLNTLFCSSVSILIVYLAARSYLATGSRAVLLLGCGALIFAMINLLAGILLTDRNTVLTVYNAGACLAGLCFVCSAFWAIIQKPSVTATPKAPGYLGFSYFCTFAVISLLVLGAMAGLTPAFFEPLQGFTLLRQVILALTVIEFVVASVCFGILYRQSRTPFLLWYSLGLLLVGMGIGTVATASNLGTLVNWVGRGGQYMGALYMLIAIWSLSKSGGDMRIPLERALRETEEKYRTIVETASEGIWISDIAARTTFVNRKMADMLGYSPEEMIGKSVYDFMDNEAAALAKLNLERRQQGHKDSYEQKYIRRDGTILWTIVSATPLRNKDGHTVASMAMLMDITERKRAEEALSQSEFRLNKAQSIAHLGNWEWDLATNMVTGSDELYRMFRLIPDPSTFFQQYIDLLVPEDRQRVLDALDNTIKNNVPYSIDYQVILRDGTPRHIHAEAVTMYDNGRPVKVFGIAQDITERKLTEEALANAHAILDTLLAQAPAGFVYFDRDLRYVIINDRLAEINGIPAAAHIGKRIHDIVPMLAPTAQKVVDQILATGMPVKDHEFSGETALAPGVRRYWNESWYPVRNASGEITGFGAIVEEITERKRNEEALHRQAGLINLTPDAIIVRRPDGEITFWSNGAESLYGWARDKAIGQHSHRLLMTRFPLPLDEIILNVNRTGGWSGELVHTAKDGRQVIVHSRWQARYDDSGSVSEILESNVDITERKRAEMEKEQLLADLMDKTSQLENANEELEVKTEELAAQAEEIECANEELRTNNEELQASARSLHEAQEYLENLINYANAPVIVWDPGFHITRFNRAFERLSGYTANEVLSKDLSILFPSASREESLAKIKKTLEGEHWESVEIPILHKYGSIRIALWNSANIYDDNKTLLATIAQGQDITARKQAESELEQAKEQAELYLDLMGHDISNLHQIMLMHLEMARELLDIDGKLESCDRELVDIPARTLEKAARLIENVRKLQKLKSGDYSREKVDLAAVLEDVLKLYSDVPGKDIAIKYTPCYGHEVWANSILKDVFSNLVDNAVKHSGDPLEIGIDINRIGLNGSSYYRVTIEDNGNGIPDDRKEEVFQRFRRGQTKAKGTGLGLYLVKRLVEGFGGYVEVQNRVLGDYTKGTRFLVYLPAIKKEQDSYS